MRPKLFFEFRVHLTHLVKIFLRWFLADHKSIEIGLPLFRDTELIIAISAIPISIVSFNEKRVLLHNFFAEASIAIAAANSCENKNVFVFRYKAVTESGVLFRVLTKHRKD